MFTPLCIMKTVGHRFTICEYPYSYWYGEGCPGQCKAIARNGLLSALLGAALRLSLSRALGLASSSKPKLCGKTKSIVYIEMVCVWRERQASKVPRGRPGPSGGRSNFVIHNLCLCGAALAPQWGLGRALRRALGVYLVRLASAVCAPS